MIGGQFQNLGQMLVQAQLRKLMGEQTKNEASLGTAGQGYLSALGQPMPTMPQMGAPVSSGQAMGAGLVGALATLLGARQQYVQPAVGNYLGGVSNLSQIDNENKQRAYQAQLQSRNQGIDLAKANYGMAEDRVQSGDRKITRLQSQQDRDLYRSQLADEKKSAAAEKTRQFNATMDQKKQDAQQRAREALIRMHPKTQKEAENAAAILFGPDSEEFKHMSQVGASLEKFFTDNHWSPEERMQWWREQEGTKQGYALERIDTTQNRLDNRASNTQDRIDTRTQKVRESVERNTLNHKKSIDMGPFGDAARAAEQLRGPIGPMRAPIPPGGAEGVKNPEGVPLAPKKSAPAKKAPAKPVKNSKGGRRYSFE